MATGRRPQAQALDPDLAQFASAGVSRGGQRLVRHGCRFDRMTAPASLGLRRSIGCPERVKGGLDIRKSADLSPESCARTLPIPAPGSPQTLEKTAFWGFAGRAPALDCPPKRAKGARYPESLDLSQAFCGKSWLRGCPLPYSLVSPSSVRRWAKRVGSMARRSPTSCRSAASPGSVKKARGPRG